MLFRNCKLNVEFPFNASWALPEVVYLANKAYDLRLIQDYLGYRDPKHTAQYIRVASKRFEKL